MSWLSVLECPLDVKEVTGPPFTMSRNTTLSPIFSQDQEREREAAVVVKISLSHAASWGVLGGLSSSTDLTMAFVYLLPRLRHIRYRLIFPKQRRFLYYMIRQWPRHCRHNDRTGKQQFH